MTDAKLATDPKAEPPPLADLADPLSTRVVALGWLLLSAALVWFFAGQAFGSTTLGTENERLRLVIRALSVALPGYPGALALVALATGKAPPRAWNLFAIPFDGWWYSTLATLWWREVKGFLGRPVAYIVLVFWFTMNGIFFFMVLNYYANPDTFGRSFEVPSFEFVTGNWITFFALCLICPALTMRLLAEESSSGTLEMLLTAPVTDAQVTLAKFLGAVTYYLFLLLAMTVYLGVLFAVSNEWDWGPILGGFLGLFLVGTMFLSSGLFASSITDNQVVAFILAVLPNLLLFFVSVVQNNVDAEWVRQALSAVDVWNMQREFVKGVVHWKALAFYLSTTFLFLFLAVRGVESHTWR